MAAPPAVDIRTEALATLLEDARDGRIQVPEFQRTLALEDDEWIKSLLASVSLGYPIGAVTLLRTGNPDVRFTTFPIVGASPSSTEPERLVVDGQHRVTMLYRVLASGQVVQTHDEHGNALGRWYYIDIRAALDPAVDRDETVISVPETGQLRTRELEWEQCVFPLRLTFARNGERERWQRGFADSGTSEEREARRELMDRFAADVLRAFDAYLVPTIIVGREWTRWSVRVHGGPEGRTLSDHFRLSDR
jgi:hypothetical protein